VGGGLVVEEHPNALPVARRIEIRKAIVLARAEEKLVVLTPDEVETLLSAYEHGRFRT